MMHARPNRRADKSRALGILRQGFEGVLRKKHARLIDRGRQLDRSEHGTYAQIREF